MKRIILLLLIAVSTVPSCIAQIPYGKKFALDKATLLDKIKGGWAGQTIGCTYGGPTEFKYKGGIIPSEEPIPLA